MALKKRIQVTDSFSMASMTDVIFLLLIFFLVTSTIVVPNVIKVSLPQASTQPASEIPQARVSITAQGELYLSVDKQPEQLLSMDDLGLRIGVFAQENPQSHIAIYADESVPYSRVVAVINKASQSGLKVVLATKVISEKNQ